MELVVQLELELETEMELTLELVLDLDLALELEMAVEQQLQLKELEIVLLEPWQPWQAFCRRLLQRLPQLLLCVACVVYAEQGVPQRRYSPTFVRFVTNTLDPGGPLCASSCVRDAFAVQESFCFGVALWQPTSPPSLW